MRATKLFTTMLALAACLTLTLVPASVAYASYDAHQDTTTGLYDIEDFATSSWSYTDEVTYHDGFDASELNISVTGWTVDSTGFWRQVTISVGSELSFEGFFTEYYDGEFKYKPAELRDSGRYYAKISGVKEAGWTGTYYVPFYLYNPNDICKLENNGWIFETRYTGKTVSLTKAGFKLWQEPDQDNNLSEARVLVEGIDYRTTNWHKARARGGYSKIDGAPTQGGDYYTDVVGTGDYLGSLRVWVYINDYHDIAYSAKATKSLVTKFKYNGKRITYSSLKLKLRIKQANGAYKYLTYGRDYKLAGWYKDTEATDEDGSIIEHTTKLSKAPFKPGSYHVLVKGTGSYRNSRVFFFTITK